MFGKDPRKVDPRGQRLAREMALQLVTSGQASEATVWLAWRPGDVEPRWVETQVLLEGSTSPVMLPIATTSTP